MMGAVIVFHDVTELRAIERQREAADPASSRETNERLRDEIGKREEARRAALSLMQDAQLAQAALRESEERLRVLFEGIDDALLVHDAGRAASSTATRPRARGWATRARTCSTLNVRDVRAGRRARRAERSGCQTTAGATIPVHVAHVGHHATTARDATLAVARDITELKQVQDELRDEQRAAPREQRRAGGVRARRVARPAGAAAQDRELRAGAGRGLRRRSSTSRAATYLDIMVDAANRMRRLIRDVLAFSRAGTAEKPFAPVDLNHVLADRAGQPLRAHPGASARRSSCGRLPDRASRDETQMVQLFQNLVGNGLKFNKPAAEGRGVRRGEP